MSNEPNNTLSRLLRSKPITIELQLGRNIYKRQFRQFSYTEKQDYLNDCIMRTKAARLMKIDTGIAIHVLSTESNERIRDAENNLKEHQKQHRIKPTI